MKKSIMNFNNLMKIKNVLVVLFTIIFISVASCSKSDEPAPVKPVVVYQEENFLDGYLASSGFNQTYTNTIDGAQNEIGTEFTPIVNGKITSITIRIPAPTNNFNITVWDKATKSVLKTISSGFSPPFPANTILTIPIPDLNLNLIKNKEYAITMNTNDWYNHKRTDGTAVTYPITVGNIKILSYKYIAGTTGAYPTTENNTVYSGDLSFNFIRTE